MFLIFRRIDRDMIKSVYWCSSKVPVILTNFQKNGQITNFIKIRPVVAEFFHEDRRTKRHTYMTKLIVTFRNFANAPKNLTFAFCNYNDVSPRGRTAACNVPDIAILVAQFYTHVFTVFYLELVSVHEN
jgi:hypothetical protein